MGSTNCKNFGSLKRYLVASKKNVPLPDTHIDTLLSVFSTFNLIMEFKKAHFFIKELVEKE